MRLSDLQVVDQLISSASSAHSHQTNFASSMKTEQRAQLFVLKQDGLGRVKNGPNISST